MAPLKGELSAKLTEGLSPKGQTTYYKSVLTAQRQLNGQRKLLRITY